jgi:hypothetical protein
MAAFVFTGTGTHSAQDPGQKVGHVVDGVRPIIPAFEEGPNIGWNVRCGGAGGLAWDIHVHVIEIFRAG